jgi:hypothetical protein
LVLLSFLFFFVLSCILPFSCLLSVLLSGAEQQLMHRDALLCNQVIRTNQFIFSVLTPLITWSPAGAFFLFFGTLTSAFYYQYPHRVWQDLVAIKCSLHFFLNRVHVPVSLRADDLDEQRQALAVFLKFASQRWVVSNPTGIGRLRD